MRPKITCRKCPHLKHYEPTGWCAAKAMPRNGRDEACDIGRRAIRNAYMKGWMQDKRKETANADHRKQRGRTAPNRALKKGGRK